MNEPGKIMLLFLVAIMFTVQAVAQKVVDNVRTMGMAIKPCTKPVSKWTRPGRYHRRGSYRSKCSS